MTPDAALTHWHIGDLAQPDTSAGVVAFTFDELDRARANAGQAICFHQAMSKAVPRLPRVSINVPSYRGKSLILLIAWLVADRLIQPDGTVDWYLNTRQGPDSIHRLLQSHGWSLTKQRRGRTVCLQGTPPLSQQIPEPRSFIAQLGKHEVTLLADYGVFSSTRIDDGTALLFEVAQRHPRSGTIADIGIGYGPLAIGLVLNGVGHSAIGTETDCVSLWLARQNAEAHDVPLELSCTSDPAAVESTPLSVCNIPTHVNAKQALPFMSALARRAHDGALLVVVHASLEARYTQHLVSAGLAVERHAGPNHVVLQARGNAVPRTRR